MLKLKSIKKNLESKLLTTVDLTNVKGGRSGVPPTHENRKFLR